MTTYLITPTLLNSFLYMEGIKDPEKKKEKELEMIKQLRKDKMPSNPAMDKGNEFESLIERVTTGKLVEELEVEHLKEFKRETLNSIVNSIAAIVRGGVWQEKVKKNLILEGQEDSYVLYGRSDVIKPSIIYDIKYTGRRHLNKFSSSTQHRLYMYCTGIEKFSYLISDGKDWWREDYFRSLCNDQTFLENIIKVSLQRSLRTHP
jgi:hypothetical protein